MLQYSITTNGDYLFYEDNLNKLYYIVNLADRSKRKVDLDGKAAVFQFVNDRLLISEYSSKTETSTLSSCTYKTNFNCHLIATTKGQLAAIINDDKNDLFFAIDEEADDNCGYCNFTLFRLTAHHQFVALQGPPVIFWSDFFETEFGLTFWTFVRDNNSSFDSALGYAYLNVKGDDYDINAIPNRYYNNLPLKVSDFDLYIADEFNNKSAKSQNICININKDKKCFSAELNIYISTYMGNIYITLNNTSMPTKIIEFRPAGAYKEIYEIPAL